jgi:RNA polymerase sigma-70 factor (ECF subfamily)
MGMEDHATVAALEELYRRRYRSFLRVAIAIGGSRDVAADTVQEGFARALRHRHEFRGEGSLEAWVWRAVLNVAYDDSRRSRRETLGDPPERAADTGRPGPNSELRAAVAALPERQRQALFLRHYADLSYDEIADALGITRGTVAATLHAAHAAVRRTMQEVAL